MHFKLFRIILIIAVNSLFISSAFSETPAHELDQLLQSVHTYHAHFSQSVQDNHGRSISKARGAFYLMRPGKFRWEVTEPDAELIIATGNQLLIYDKELQQLTIKHLKSNLGETPALLLTQNDMTSEQHFNVKLESSPKSGEWFLLTPKDHGSFFAEMHLDFENHILKVMKLRDSLDQITTVQFNQIEVNSPIAESLFHLKVPPHTDVIHEAAK